MSKQIDDKWTAWAIHNIGRGCNSYLILQKLIDKGFGHSSIIERLGIYFPEVNLEHLFNLGKCTSSSISVDRPDYLKLDSLIPHVQDQYDVKRINCNKLTLYKIENFMTEEECAEISDVIRMNCRPSTVYGIHREGFRTNYSSDLAFVNSPLVTRIDLRIARCLGICLPYSESIQGQLYTVGQEFKSHTDYFEAYQDRKELLLRGQRTWTFMIYLTETKSGGSTNFVRVRQSFLPKIGTALAWNNLYSNGRPNLSSIHCGMPVKLGEKIIITKWFREKGQGKMFYR